MVTIGLEAKQSSEGVQDDATQIVLWIQALCDMTQYRGKTFSCSSDRFFRETTSQIVSRIGLRTASSETMILPFLRTFRECDFKQDKYSPLLMMSKRWKRTHQEDRSLFKPIFQV